MVKFVVVVKFKTLSDCNKNGLVVDIDSPIMVEVFGKICGKI